jgi:hypothetical protein
MESKQRRLPSFDMNSKKSQFNHRTRPRHVPMMSLEAKNGGAFWGAAFRKFSTLGTDYLRVPARRFLHFLNRPFSIPSQLPRGKGAPAESFHAAGAPSSRERRTESERRREFPPLIQHHRASLLRCLIEVREFRSDPCKRGQWGPKSRTSHPPSMPLQERRNPPPSG